MDSFKGLLDTIDSVNGEWFPYLLLGTGVFFTIYLKFPQIRFFRHALRIVTGRYEKDTMPGDTSHFQALTTALSGTVGTGNIGGVGLAIYIGGPAALFWMWATAFLGMTTKFVECTLSHKYREIEDDGSIAGGPMFYMEKRLNMKWLAIIFAIATVVCSFGTGNMPQINNIASTVESTFMIPPWVTGGVLSVLLALIIIGGIKRIAKVTEKVVPLMSLIYLVGAFAVIGYNYENIIPSFGMIIGDIFTGTAAVGGFLGSTFAFALTKGVQRGLYSNEAGQGSAAIAHSAARADEPVSEGMVAILEPFIDTLIICTLTGLAILSSGVWTEKVENLFQRSDMEIVAGVFDEGAKEDLEKLGTHLNGGDGDVVTPFEGELILEDGVLKSGQNITVIHARSLAEEMIFTRGDQKIDGSLRVVAGQLEDTAVEVNGRSRIHSAVLTTEAFKRGAFGDWGKFIVSIGLLLFAFSTVISWSYYGDRAITYLLGTRAVLPYRIVYTAAFFAAALADTSIVWSLANVAIVVMAVPNLFGILFLHKDMRQSVGEYWTKFKADNPDEAKRLKIR